MWSREWSARWILRRWFSLFSSSPVHAALATLFTSYPFVHFSKKRNASCCFCCWWFLSPFQSIHSLRYVTRLMRQSRVNMDSRFSSSGECVRCDYDTRKKFLRKLMHTRTDRSEEFRAVWQEQQQTKRINRCGDAQYVKNSKTAERIMGIYGRHNRWWQRTPVCVRVNGETTVFFLGRKGFT